MNVSKGNINVMILMLYEAPVLEYHPHLMKSYISRDDSPRFRLLYLDHVKWQCRVTQQYGIDIAQLNTTKDSRNSDK
jgi:hypothetical protein